MRTATLLALALLAGCGEDTPLFESGLPPETRIEDLTPAESEQLCSALLDSTLEALDLRLVCQAVAARTYPDRAECTEATSQCERNKAVFAFFVLAASKGMCGTVQPRERCQVTIEEVEACYNVALARGRADLGRLSCGAPLPPDVGRDDRVGIDLAAHPECATLLACRDA